MTQQLSTIQVDSRDPVAEPFAAEQAADDVCASRDRPLTSPLPARSARWNAALRWIRRVHLYSGLFMFPWVMLYGASAYLFNHPGAFSDQQFQSFSSSDAADTPLAALPTPHRLAEQVVAAIERAEAERGGATEFHLPDDDGAQFTRNQATVSASGGNRRHSVSVNLLDGAGTIRSRSEAPRPNSSAAEKPPFADQNLAVDAPLAERLKDGVAAVLAKQGLPDAKVTTVTLPELTFQLEADGQPWQVTYNLDRESLVAHPVGTPPELQPLPTRNFLTRLHTTHGYPEELGARWFWAIAVDGMFVTMVFWGFSGLLMWWQLKGTRRSGILFLGASAIVSTAMMWNMHHDIAATPRRGERTASPPAGKTDRLGGTNRGERGESAGRKPSKPASE
jgi:hypothetical protein